MSETTTKLRGVDLSRYNGSVDFVKLKEQGIDFVILQAGYGRYATQKDSRFEENYNRAKAAGLKVGAYWYCYANSGSDALQEADACIQVLKGKQFEFPIYYDFEEDRCKEGAELKLKTFCERLESAGYFVGIYSSASWFKDVIPAYLKTRFTPWLAHWYVGTPSFNAPVWQYSAKGRIEGISGDVDLDYAFTDFEPIIREKGLNGCTPVDVPEEPASRKHVLEVILDDETIIRKEF